MTTSRERSDRGAALELAGTAVGEESAGWSWSTANATSVRIEPPSAGRFALIGMLRGDGRIEGRAVPADATLADTRRDDFAWAPVTLSPAPCDGAGS